MKGVKGLDVSFKLEMRESQGRRLTGRPRTSWGGRKGCLGRELQGLTGEGGSEDV